MVERMHPDATVTADAEPDLYLVLQVVPFAEPEVVQAAYRTLARKYHPDAGGDGSRMTALNRAWEVLGDRERRAAYDRERRKPRSVEPMATQRPSSDAATVDFGRYAGWSIAAIAVEDPDYLRWLRRTPIGRRLQAEIDARLAEQEAAAAALVPRPTRPGPSPRWSPPWAAAERVKRR
jgi:molecular chaperone DnaJ